MINGTRAVALCLEDIHPNNHTNNDTRTNTEDFKEKMEEVAHRYLDMLSEGMAKAKEHHQQIINNTIEEVRANTVINLDSAPFAQKVNNLANTLLTTTDTLRDFMEQTNVAVNSLKEATTKAAHIPTPSASTPAITTYMTVTQCNTHPNHAEVIAQGQLSNMQLLIDFDKESTDSTIADLTERDMVVKASTALKIMNINDPDKPQTVQFMAAHRIQNNQILYQLNSASATEWIRKPATHKAFLMAYSSLAKIRNKLYHDITEFVPTTFNTDDDYSHNKLEATNSLKPSSITWSRYMKPPNLHSANQKVAHVILGLTSKNAANKVIQHSLYIEGKHVTV